MMLFKKTKNLLAALLCICMVAAIIPATAPAAQAAESVDSMVFDFTNYGMATLPLDQVNYSVTGGSWKYHSYSASTWSGTPTFTWDGTIGKWGGGLQLYVSPSTWVALELHIPYAGTYDVSLDYTKVSSGKETKMYLIPKSSLADDSEASITAALTTANYLKETNFAYDASDAGRNPVKSALNIAEGGQYLLVFTSNYTGFAFPGKLTFTTSKTSHVFDFTKYGSKWATGLPLNQVTYDVTQNGWQYYGHSESTWSNPTYTWDSGDICKWNSGLSFRLNNDASRWVALELDIASAGIYDMSVGYYKYNANAPVNVYLVQKSALASETEADITAALTNPFAYVFGYYAPDATNHNPNATGVVVPESGKYLLVFRSTGKDASRTTTFPSSLTISRTGNIPTEAAALPASDIFGSKYAYVTKNASGEYNVSFVGGLHSIAGYEYAGFEVIKSGTIVAEAVTRNAYKEIKIAEDSLTKTPTDYGVGEDGYIFFAEAVSGDSAYAFDANTAYIIRPYVVEDGEKVFHDFPLSFTISE